VAFIRVIEVIAGPKNGQGVKIDSLRIEFKAEKTGTADPNKAAVKIYNLSEKTHNQIAAAGNHITVRAGYADQTVASICFGDIISARRYRDGMNIITELEAYDGMAAMKGSQVSVSFAKNTSAVTVAEAFLDALSMPYKGKEHIPADARYEHGFPYIGMAFDGLKDVLNRFGLRYTVQNEMLYILKEGQAADSTGLELTPKSGLLTTPQPVSDKSGDDDIKASPAGKWKFSAMLFPELVPGAACTVKSSSLEGTVKISEAVYSGDNGTGEFRIDIEAEEL
jgi:hypothetical protein